VLAAALRSATTPRAPRWLGWRVLVPALGLFALLPLLLLRGGRPDAGDFGAKGGAAGPVVDVGCAGDCKPGATLVFRTQAVREPAYLAAWAVGPDGGRIWYFPTATGELAKVAPHQAPEVLRQGGRIGDAHTPGRWDLHVLLLRQPLSRDAISSLAAAAPEVVASARVPLEVHAR
jgi:hypothetical protein